MLTATALAAAIARIEARIGDIRDRLNDADSKLGDGDTGMTVASLVAALRGDSDNLPSDLGATLAQCGRACSQASGSSLAAVIAMAFNAAGRNAKGVEQADAIAVSTMLGAACEIIEQRSGATPGDKSVLDSLVAMRDAFASASANDAMDRVALTAARSALEAFRGREAKLGRARMYSTKSIGLDDPGMLAAVLVLEAATKRG
jgi:dihydroxyacetone kinase